MKVIVAQKGAREHFLAARALHRRGCLAQLIVDWYPPKGALFQRVNFIGAKAKAALTGHCAEIPDALVRATRLRSLSWKWKERVGVSQGFTYEKLLETDAAFARFVGSIDLPPHDIFFGYSYASLEALRVEKERGKFCILDQIDPGEKEHEIVREEQKRWRQLVTYPDSTVPPETYRRLHEEWSLADVILVNSEWSRQCIILKGAPEEKVSVIPLAYELSTLSTASERPYPKISSSPSVRILWVGRVNLQKGIQYLIEAARLLKDEPVEFIIVGEINISQQAVREAPANMRWVGKVVHALTGSFYNSATAFVLPTLSDGFALTQLEAMAYGLPIIVTPNCGTVVEEGRTGFLVPPRDPQALAEAIIRFVQDRELSDRMSPRCRETATMFSIDSYGERLLNLIEQAIKRKNNSSRQEFQSVPSR